MPAQSSRRAGVDARSIEVGGAVGGGAVRRRAGPPVPGRRGAGVARRSGSARARAVRASRAVSPRARGRPGAGARARGASSPTMALGWMLRSWFLLPDPSSWSVRMCHGAPDTSPAPSRTPPAGEVPVGGLREVATPRQEHGRPARGEVDGELRGAVAAGRTGMARAADGRDRPAPDGQPSRDARILLGAADRQTVGREPVGREGGRAVTRHRRAHRRHAAATRAADRAATPNPCPGGEEVVRLVPAGGEVVVGSWIVCAPAFSPRWRAGTARSRLRDSACCCR